MFKNGISFLALSFFSFVSLVANEVDDQAENIYQEFKESRREEEKAYFKQKITNLADRYFPALKNHIDIWGEVGLLYLVPSIKSMKYTSKKENILSTDDFASKRLIGCDFEWQPGYEVAVGYVNATKFWDISFKACHYHSATHEKSSTHNDPYLGMFPIWSISDNTLQGDYVTQAKIKGRLNYDRMYIQLGLFKEVAEFFVIRGFIGLDNVFLKQGYDVYYTGGVFSSGTDHIHLKNNFWGIGPQVGFVPWCSLGAGFSWFGEASLSWLLGTFNVNQSENYLSNNLYRSDNDSVKGRWATDLETGFGWKRPFYKDQFFFSLKLTGRYLAYFQQNQLKKDHFHQLGDGAVQMQGLVLSALFDF